ncbi:MAG: ABC transporter permease subunit [Planctomycetota bacterium]
MTEAQSESAFTGRRRERKTRASVKWGDRLARSLITLGGIGTIVAVLGVCVFLVWVALPLFHSAEVKDERRIVPRTSEAAVVATKTDDSRVAAWKLLSDGSVETLRFDTREKIETLPGPEGAEVTAIAVDAAATEIAFGDASGSVRTGVLEFADDYLNLDEAAEELQGLEEGEVAVWDRACISRIPGDLLRIDRVHFELEPAFVAAAGDPVVALDRIGGSDTVVVTLHRSGALRLHALRRETDMFSDEVTITADSRDLVVPSGATLRSVHFNDLGDQLFALREDGELLRYSLQDSTTVEPVERVNVVPEGQRLTAAAFLLGRRSLAVGTDGGALSIWFGMKPEGAKTADGIVTRRVHRLAESGPAIVCLNGVKRSRILLAGDETGHVRVFYATTGEELLSVTLDGDRTPRVLSLSPREDSLIAGADDATMVWDVDLGHPAATMASMFAKVHYEDYDEPEHVWQSSASTDDTEPKFGFMPLVFGTLKATFYSLLFGVPIALLAAVFGTEFLSKRTKNRIKPAIEMMASLPSVVLGFLGGLVFAPIVETIVPAVMSLLVTLPVCLALGAFLWQIVPRRRSVRLEPWRPVGMALALAIGGALAFAVGPVVEKLLFAGDVKQWLTGQVGSAVGGWVFLTLPICALAVAVLGGRLTHPWLVRRTATWTRRRFATVELLRFLVLTVVVIGTALLLAWLISLLGFDARGTFIDTYVQRNALVVGFVMGFAVIPIIYTIADDALSAVPAHLRAASLGAGATAWQTATRVIIPTAASGLFSAVMIGLGRAVGETMIVLMAAGNTPIMDMNIFNGFKTLAANIAVELPEAPVGGTHYRTLYFAALVLFALTFVINALAESVRQRFRKRAYQL